MSQSELARRVGISQPAIANLIKRGTARSPHIHKIARELKTTPEYLNCETDDNSVDLPDNLLTASETELLQKLRRLSPEDQKMVMQLTKSLAAAERGEK